MLSPSAGTDKVRKRHNLDVKTMNSPEAQSEHKRKVPAPRDNTKRPGTKVNSVRTREKRNPNPQLPCYPTQRSSKGSPILYIMAIGACVLLGGSYAMYLSTSAQETWYAAPATDATFEPTPVSVTQPKPAPVKEALSNSSPLTSSGTARLPVRPNAVIDVPHVGLRNIPDIHMKASPASLKRGERVEVLKKISGKGPAWVKIRTKGGKVGWVIASVVSPKKAG